jgi:hypothetical protein
MTRVLALGPVAAASMALGGCIAPVREVRDYGAVRTPPGAEVTVSQERVASPAGPTCRSVVTTTGGTREVDIRRSFVDPRRQEANLAFVMLAGIGSSFIAYDAASIACNGNSGCTGTLSSATWPIAAVTAGLAAIPLAFAAYNAWKVQDAVRIEPAPPTVEPGPWRPCDP